MCTFFKRDSVKELGRAGKSLLKLEIHCGYVVEERGSTFAGHRCLPAFKHSLFGASESCWPVSAVPGRRFCAP